jgi:hypothetical protein
MPSNASNKEFIGRAAAVYTALEVDGAVFDLNNAWGSIVTVDVAHTLGPATSCTLKFYGSNDGVTYRQLMNPTTAALYEVAFTANASVHICLPALVGLKWFKVSATGASAAGYVATSLAFKYRYLRRGSQG